MFRGSVRHSIISQPVCCNRLICILLASSIELRFGKARVRDTVEVPEAFSSLQWLSRGITDLSLARRRILLRQQL